MMEVVAGGERAGAPFSRHNVQEWSRLDQLTGLLEHARVETDHWTASTSNSSHHFGKVVDSRSRNLADGGQEQRQQTKQLEVFQANIPGGSVQVIRSSTSSSWQSHKTLSGGSGWTGTERLALPNSENQDFDHLKLVLNPLDLSSQKTKASVGRSGSIGSRRPPSRPRSIVGLKLEEASELADYRQLKELSSICHKAHEEAKQDLSQSRHSPHDLSNGFSCDQNDSITNDDSQVAEANYNFRNSASSEVTKSSGHLSLIRKKSCSSEDLHAVDEDGNEAASVGSDWRRSSKVRRSLQFPPKPNSIHKENIVIPVTKSVSEIKKEIEARKQLVTNSFKTHQWNNFAELEGVLGVVRNGSHEEELKDSSNSSEAGAVSPTKTAAKKRQTFITVESLKEVKGRLRKLNSPVEEILKTDDVDDGIVTEVKPSSPIPENTDNIPKNSVKSYVFGMEVMLRKTKPPIVGTGSLESRSSSKFLTNGSNRSEEWYNRRKSYGFEPVSNQQSNYSSFENSKIESSTDSGICRSSDMFSSWSKLAEKSTNQTSPIKTTHSIVIKPYQQTDVKRAIDIEGDAVIQKGRKTVVNLTGSNVNSSWGWNSKTELSNPQLEVCKESVGRGKIADAIRSLNEKSTLEKQRLSEPITISIPIQQTAKTNNTDPTNLLLKQTNITSSNTDKIETSTHSKNVIAPYSELLFGKDAGETSSIDTKSEFENIPWRGNRTKTLSNFFDSEFKRHSIAVDQAKYLSNKKSYGSYYLNGIHDVNDKEGDAHMNVVPYSKTDRDSNKIITESDHEASEKKQKKVEFCKTEVHFAAEPGRFNIVETDGKPPPSNLYRRRRKTTSDAPNRSGLPEIRFGDTPYEKNMLTTESTSAENFTSKSLTFRGSPVFHDNEKDDSVIFTHPNTTVLQSKQFSKLSHQQIDSTHTSETQNNSEDDNPKPRSILKNNIPKPKPYILGESPDSPLTAEEGSSWGVKLKSIKSDEENSKWQTGSHFPKETEFQRLLKSLKPAANKPPDLAEIAVQPEPSSTAADNGLEVRISSSSFPPDHRRASWSVADRIKNVEDTRGYSTKVNFGPQETTVIDASKIDDVTSRVNASDGLKSSWTIKEQKSSFDTRPAEQPEPGLRSGKKITYSQSFSTPVNQCPPEQTRDSFSRNILKSTSLVMEVQNPSINHLGEFEKKVSVKEISTNLIRDNCGKNVQKVKEPLCKKNLSSVSEKVSQYSQKHNTFEKERKKTYQDINTKTIPPVRKISSATQTYFVNRSAVRRDLHQATSIKINTSLSEKHKIPEKSEEAMNGIPGVLNALDDLSRCIDEVIIESPQKVCKAEVPKASVFSLKEDFKKETNNHDNILSVASQQPTVSVMNQLDLLREIVDSGELSEDSLKADEEVRAYMSTDNDDDTLSSEWSGSWSRVRSLKQSTKQVEKKVKPSVADLVPRISPSFGSRGHSPLHHRQGLEAAVSTHPEVPRITSISLHYADAQQPSPMQPVALFRESLESQHPTTSFVSRNLLNTDSSGISSKVEMSLNGDRTWSFSKVPLRETTASKFSESDYIDSTKQPSTQKPIRLQVRDITSSPSRFSRNSQSPTKEALFLERTAERNVLYNENNRQMSSSPTSGTSKKVTSAATIKVDAFQNNSRKSDKIFASKSVTNQISKSASQSSSVHQYKHKVEDKLESVKKSDTKKSLNEMKTKERKLSTSSSGRDGWLNTPKEVQARKKSESYIRKQDTRSENKISERTIKPNVTKPNQKRTESPIYQNREIYAERRDSNDNTETESTILEELTKAADQILLAVNGYTDDDSFRASSEDEFRKRREKPTSQPLCTISELPNKKTNTNKFASRQSLGVIKSTRSTDLRREYRSSSKTRVGKTSSNSSMDSGPSSEFKSGDVKPLLSPEDRSKRRAARLLQRASSRELLLQTAASSSEDMGSGSDTGSLRTKRVFRRSRLQNGKLSGSKQDLTSIVAETRTKERVQRSAITSEAHTSHRAKTQVENRCSRHSKTITGSTAGERRERRPQTVVTHSSRTQKKKSETSQSEAKSGLARE
ncbi:uncharacterized protein LOC124367405 isoform X2 [Homalodisca vitripennis]|uniref:uncharacterized protein LOC124367405 isoform X2 n=1 Tax=Homalodisca vitripennis TaxID=197043 RepID=UPI001EEB378B|nr:uncharacterized protein LOC124367405 isoform X2 [Homalodisca vitripennis]